jgi:Fe-S oxidoreductase
MADHTSAPAPSSMQTALDWSAYEDAGMGDAYADIPRHGGDFAKAVAVCINSRQCESATGKGVMCPSWRVTGDPALSTGGRVRLLKAALNAELVDTALAEPELARAMDLCVGCKGCKRECESNVDMALIRTEYLAQRARRDGVGLRARLFAALPRWLHRHRTAARHLISARNRHRWLARLGERLLGIAADVPLPEPAAAHFRETPIPSEPPVESAADRPELVLLTDCFCRHFEPDIARDALRVLEAAGYRVLTAAPAAGDAEPDRPLCCGRTDLAQGLVAQAQAEAGRTVAALLPHARAGRWIIGLEPSCLLGLRDEALTLGLGAAAREVAGRALLLEEFLAKEIMAKRLDLPLRAAGSETGPDAGPDALGGTGARSARVLVHGHCHQKAVGGMKPLRKVLKLVPGLDFELLDTGCCGMAGTFGLEREHADLARRMAEQELLPRLAEATDATVIANGFSCRQQIRAHTRHRPLHLVQLLARGLMVRDDQRGESQPTAGVSTKAR